MNKKESAEYKRGYERALNGSNSSEGMLESLTEDLSKYRSQGFADGTNELAQDQKNQAKREAREAHYSVDSSSGSSDSSDGPMGFWIQQLSGVGVAALAWWGINVLDTSNILYWFCWLWLIAGCLFAFAITIPTLIIVCLFYFLKSFW